MKRLLIISRCSEPRGGADRIVADLIRQLPDFGWNASLALTEGRLFNDPEKYSKFHKNLPFDSVNATLGTRRSRLRALAQVINESQPQIVLSMRVFDAYEVVSALKMQSRQSPRLAIGVRAFEAPYFADLKRYAPFVDLCVTSGELIANTCCSFSGIERNRVFNVPGGVIAATDAERRRARKIQTPVRLLYAGRLDMHQKRCQDLVALIRHLRDHGVEFRMTIAGAGPAEAELKAALQTEVTEGIVQFTGWLSREVLYSTIYPQHDIFVHCAAWEGVTIAPREAMAHGLVPVISEFVGLKEECQFLHQKNSLTFPVGNTDLAAAHVKTLIDNPEVYRQYSDQAILSQTGRYSFAGSFQAWADALDQCLTLPAATANQLPRISNDATGRLAGIKLPAAFEDLVRKMLRRPVQHQSPGSEWPTSSGLLTPDEESDIIDRLS